MIDNLRPLTQEQRQGAQESARSCYSRHWAQACARTLQSIYHLQVSAIRDAAHFLIMLGAAAGSLHAIGNPAVCNWLADLWSSCVK